VAVGLDGTLWVADTGNNRVLGWQNGASGFANGAPATFVLGQPDFHSYFVNNTDGQPTPTPTQSSLAGPTAIAIDPTSGNLWVPTRRTTASWSSSRRSATAWPRVRSMAKAALSRPMADVRRSKPVISASRRESQLTVRKICSSQIPTITGCSSSTRVRPPLLMPPRPWLSASPILRPGFAVMLPLGELAVQACRNRGRPLRQSLYC
jgi:hypothetical protein